MSSVTCTDTAVKISKIKTHNGTSMPKKEFLVLFLFWEGDGRQPAHHTNGGGKAACITVPHLPEHALGTERCN